MSLDTGDVSAQRRLGRRGRSELLRFCLVTTFYPPYHFGGDAHSVERLAHALARRGHRVTVVHDVDAHQALSQGLEPAPRADPEGIEVVRLRSRTGRLSPLLTHQTGRPLVHGRTIRSILGDGRFDVINYHNVSLVGGPGILSLGRALKLFTATEHWLVCPTNVLWRHNREPCTGRECLRCMLRYRRPPQLWRYTGSLERQLAHVDVFIAKSAFSRQKHIEFGFPRPMEVLPNFLPDAEVPAGSAVDSRPQGRPYFLFVGRLERLKGLDDVIPLFRHYEEADLVIAGEGTHRAALEALAAGNPRVRFLGRLAPRELESYYRHAIAVIAPSAGFEAFPTVLIEGFKQATPGIARRVGPYPEIVERCGGGLLFGDADELLAAMRRLQRDPAVRRRFAERAREGFVGHWSESVVLPRYLELVRRAADDRERSSAPLPA